VVDVSLLHPIAHHDRAADRSRLDWFHDFTLKQPSARGAVARRVGKKSREPYDRMPLKT